MRTTEIMTAGEPAGADRDRAVLGAYQGASLVLCVGALFAITGTRAPALSRPQRRRGLVAVVTTAVAGAAGVLSPMWTARVVRRFAPPWLMPAAAVASIAASGGEYSPMYFPGVILTAFGGARLGPTRILGRTRTASLALGAGAGVSWLTIVLASAKPLRRGVSAQLQWALGMVPVFVGAPLIGGELGDLALSVRRLERMRRRDRASLAVALEELPDIAAKISAAASELEASLLRIATRQVSESSEATEMKSALAGVRGGTAAHTLAPLLVAAANERPLDLEETLDATLRVYREGLRAARISIELTMDMPGVTALHPRWTGALVRAAKTAVDNSYMHQVRSRLSRIEVTVRGEVGRVELTVSDDGGGAAPSPAQWGTGLRELHSLIYSLDGRLSFDQSDGGVVMHVRLPATSAAPRSDPIAVPISDRVDAAIGRCVAVVRPVNVVGGVACVAFPWGRRGEQAAGAFLALATLDRVWSKARPTSRARARLSQSAVSLLWPSEARPAGGWTGLALVEAGAGGDNKELARQTALTFVGYAVSAARLRGRVSPGDIERELGFTIVCAAIGYVTAFARERLVSAEAGVLGLRERAAMIEQLGRSIYYRHEIINRLRASDDWYDAGISDSDDGQRILELIADLDDLTLQVLGMLTVSDALQDLKEHLETRLDPVRITISGQRPVEQIAGTPGEDLAVRRARHHVALARLADEIADRCLARYPARLSGRSPLERVHIHISEHDEFEMLVTVRPIPPATVSDDNLDGIQYALAQLAGNLLDGYDDAGLTFTIPADALISE